MTEYKSPTFAYQRQNLCTSPPELILFSPKLLQSRMFGIEALQKPSDYAMIDILNSLSSLFNLEVKDSFPKIVPTRFNLERTDDTLFANKYSPLPSQYNPPPDRPTNTGCTPRISLHLPPESGRYSDNELPDAPRHGRRQSRGHLSSRGFH